MTMADHPGVQVGAAIGSAATAAIGAIATPQSPVIGPVAIILFGQPLPLLPAIIGAAGVIATRQFAPVSSVELRLDRSGRLALTAMMVIAMLALVLAGERRPLVVIGIAGGLGYSGVAIFELLAAGVVRAARTAIDIFARGIRAFLSDPKDGQ